MSSIKVVVDTNIFVSALFKSPSVPYIVVETIFENDDITIVYDDGMYLEYVRVLNKKKFNLPKKDIDRTINQISEYGEKIESFPQYAYFHDESDKKFYEVFKTANADYLITGNGKHFPEDDRIVSPREFVELMNIETDDVGR